MAFLVNFRLRSDSDRPESEASPTENGACAFKLSISHFYYCTQLLDSVITQIHRPGWVTLWLPGSALLEAPHLIQCPPGAALKDS